MQIRCKDAIFHQIPKSHVITYVDIARATLGRPLQIVVYFLSVHGSLGYALYADILKSKEREGMENEIKTSIGRG